LDDEDDDDNVNKHCSIYDEQLTKLIIIITATHIKTHKKDFLAAYI